MTSVKFFREPGRLALLAITILLYWIPLLWWAAGAAAGGRGTTSLEDYPFWKTTWVTAYNSALVAVAATIAAYPLAIMWRFSSSELRRVLGLIMTAPLILGLLARNYSWIGMLSSTGFLTSMGWSLLGGGDLLYTTFSIGLVMACIFVPITFFILIQGISSVTSSHIDAARTCGLSDWQLILYLVIPMTFRAAILSFGLVLAMAVGYFITPRMIGGGNTQFISNIILELINQGQFSQASTMALAFLGCMIAPVALITWYSLRLRKRSTGR